MTIAKTVFSSFVKKMSQPLNINEMSIGKKFQMAFKTRLSLITGGFLKHIGKEGSSLMYKGEELLSYAKASLKFNEANLRYMSILKLLAFILKSKNKY